LRRDSWGLDVRVHHFWVQKEGNSEAEYEDACAHQACQFAVADGATESSFSREWANILVKGFATDASWTGLFQQARGRSQWRQDIQQQYSRWLEAMRERWRERLGELKSSRGGQWPWFVEDRIREGAVATFCGLVLLPDMQRPIRCCQRHQPGRSANRRYFCLAVGDACMFHLRDDQLVFSFPVRKAADFSNTPPLLCSQSRPPAWPTAPLRWRIRRWKAGDTFLLMTDALARWFLSEYESGNQPWQEIRRQLLEPDADTPANPAGVGEADPPAAAVHASPEATPHHSANLTQQSENHASQPLASGPATTVATQAQERFRSWVGHLRMLNKLANDDVTLLIIQP
jgi:hypothetical protein